jgi:hypothetical protein
MRPSIAATIALIAISLVGCVHTERGETVTVRAIRASGETFYIPHPQPIWSFAITNRGSSDFHWMSSVEVSGGSDPDYSLAGGYIDWPEGTLASGQGIVTNMIVPAKSGSVWRGYVEYWSVSHQDSRTYKDEWHH